MSVQLTPSIILVVEIRPTYLLALADDGALGQGRNVLMKANDTGVRPLVVQQGIPAIQVPGCMSTVSLKRQPKKDNDADECFMADQHFIYRK